MTRAPSRVFCVVAALAFGFSLWESRGQTYFSDEWGRWILYPEQSFEFQLHGHSGHLIIGQLWFYRAVVEVFGADDYLVFRIIAAGLLTICGWLLYLYLRERADPWLAVAGATVLLFLGAAWEVVATPYGIVILLPVALGLGALCCLRREEIGWRLAACGLLIAGVISQSFALPFVAGAFVILALEGRRRLLRDLWIPGVPLLLYVAWFAWSRIDEVATSSSFPADFSDPLRGGSPLEAPVHAIGVVASALAAVAGLYRNPLDDAQSMNNRPGYLLLALLIVAGFLWLRPALSAGLRRLAAPLAMLAVYGLMIGLAVGPGRGVNSSRYLFLGGLLALMVVVLTFPRRPLRRVELALVGLACALSVSVNVIQYHQAAGELRTLGSWNRAALAALRDFEPSGGYPDPAASLDASVGPSPDDVSNNMTFSAPEYLAAIARFGDPADSAAELNDATADELAAADRLLMRAHGFYLRPAAGLRGECRALDGAPGAPATHTLAIPAGETITAGTGVGGPGFRAAIRGVARTFDAAAVVPGGFSVRLTGPAGPIEWQVRFAFLQPGRVCIARSSS